MYFIAGFSALEDEDLIGKLVINPGNTGCLPWPIKGSHTPFLEFICLKQPKILVKQKWGEG